MEPFVLYYKFFSTRYFLIVNIVYSILSQTIYRLITISFIYLQLRSRSSVVTISSDTPRQVLIRFDYI